MWQQGARNFFDSVVQPVPALSRLGHGVNKQPPMENDDQSFGDSPWQSIRLGFGAVLLILCGLGLFLLDSSTHTSTAQSAISHRP
jgi:hypothetical protein